MEFSTFSTSLSASSLSASSISQSSRIMMTINRIRFVYLVLFICLISGNLFDVTNARIWSNNNDNGQSSSLLTSSSSNNNNNNNQADVFDRSSQSSSLLTDKNNNNNNNNLSQEDLLYSIRPAATSSSSSSSSSSSPTQNLATGTDETIRNYRSSIDTIRFMSPYVLQNYLASRLQSSDYLGKRMGSEFLGKKRSTIAANNIRTPLFGNYFSDGGIRRLSLHQQQQQQQQPQQQLLLPSSQLSILTSPYLMVQKKMGSEFLGR
ncbi:uncharacterized protein LOC113789770 isoform X2 [Dermatophagoides pteronyssinus]|uniref:uncharacterized protein LOC113789770 isoform X2 n=1 Tax=Dermatophagoides pteronyssinus TaxID=6956 RepID=UPI003F66279B